MSKKTQYCRDYGGRYGLTCGYWVNSPIALDRHVLKYHGRTDPVYDCIRGEGTP